LPSQWLRIEKPGDRDSFALDPMIPDSAEHVIFKASASADIGRITWLIDGERVGEGMAPNFRFDWAPHPGTFTVEARSGNRTDRRMIEVRE
jgi:hypothetical protein